MDASTLTAFCAMKELSFVEQAVRNGVKGAWFCDRKNARTFIAAEDIRLPQAPKPVRRAPEPLLTA